MQCKYCGYEWTPKKEKPKECPKCKRYIKDDDETPAPMVAV